jgi:hypothetical protein
VEKIRQFFKNLESIDAWPESIAMPEYRNSTTPAMFQDFAEEDLRKGDPQSSANSLAHAKRALDCQLDFFLESYGLLDLSQSESWGTAKKISLTGDLGLVPPRILYKVNKARNDLEHRYELPSKQTAENAIDVVGMFVAAIDAYLYPLRKSVRFEIPDHDLDLIKDPASAMFQSELNVLYCSLSRQKSIFEVEGKINALSVNVSVNIDNFDDYMFLLTLVLHFNKFHMINGYKYVERLKYLSAK